MPDTSNIAEKRAHIPKGHAQMQIWRSSSPMLSPRFCNLPTSLHAGGLGVFWRRVVRVQLAELEEVVAES